MPLLAIEIKNIAGSLLGFPKTHFSRNSQRTTSRGIALILLVIAASTATASAYELNCETDEFTDEEHCDLSIKNEGAILSFSTTDSGENYVISLLDFSEQPLFTDYMLLRVDENPARDFSELPNPIYSDRGFVIVALKPDYGKELAAEIINGEEIKLRLSEYSSGYEVYSFTTEGFESAWKEFNEAIGF